MLVDELGPGRDGQGFVDIRLLAPLRFSDLYRMHHHIPSDEGFLAVGAEVNATMARRVTRRRDQYDFIIDPPRILHPFYLSRLDNWHDILLDHGLICRVRFISPMLPFTFVEQIRGIGKGRSPAPLLQLGIPARVVEVHVGTKHVIDGFRGAANGSQVSQVQALTRVPLGKRKVLLVVADTGIDDDRVMSRLKKKCVDAQQHPFLSVNKGGLEPLQVRIEVFLTLIDVEEPWACWFQAIHNFRETDVANGKPLNWWNR